MIVLLPPLQIGACVAAKVKSGSGLKTIICAGTYEFAEFETQVFLGRISIVWPLPDVKSEVIVTAFVPCNQVVPFEVILPSFQFAGNKYS